MPRIASIRLLALTAAVGLLALLLGPLWNGAGDNALAVEPREPVPRGELTNEETRTISIFENAAQSVVYITTLAHVIDFWTRDLTEVPRGTGSGVVWDEHGHIVTNFHLLDGAQRAQVRLIDQRAFDAELVGAGPEHDLAVLRIDWGDEAPPPLPMGTSADLKVGQQILAIGNPFGLDHTLTTGVISALNRSIPTGRGVPIENLIQIDAAINPGNSGGPLLDSAGRLIGINTAIYSPSGAFAGIGFAVPADTVNRVVPQLIRHGRYLRPVLGITTDDQLSRRIGHQLGIEGVAILGVGSGSPAHRAGLRPAQRTRDGRLRIGDVITAIDGRPVTDLSSLLHALDRYEPGHTVTVTVFREGEKLEKEITLTEPPPR